MAANNVCEGVGARWVGCGGMLVILLLMAVLSPTIAPHSTFTASPTTDAMTRYVTMSPPPTVFRNPRVTSKPRRTHMRGKADSPMLNYIFDSYATSNKHFHDNFRPPSFEDLTSEETILDADTGATVLFECKVTALRDKTVSWLRVFEDKNFELLTVNLDTHAADTRYRVDLAGENWKLSLADAKVQDSGVYCCHVSTHPPMLRRFKLTVHAPSIKMAKEAFLETGTTLSLKCLVMHLNPGETESVLHWFRGNTTTSLDEIRGGVLIETDHLTLTSHLQVARLKMDDAGNYTCALEAPIQMRAVARVHVLQGSSLAELQSGVKTTTSYLSLLLTTLLLALGRWFNDVR